MALLLPTLRVATLGITALDVDHSHADAALDVSDSTITTPCRQRLLLATRHRARHATGKRSLISFTLSLTPRANNTRFMMADAPFNAAVP